MTVKQMTIRAINIA
ncbi:hypothetical protein ECMA6_2534, partial [Escherichia coli MA6]